MLSKICQNCGEVYYKRSTTSLKDWEESKFCSGYCRTYGTPVPWLIKHQIKKGQHLSPKTQFKSKQTLGDKNVNWKGDDASYSAIHHWIDTHFTKTGICEICGKKPIRKNGKIGTQWATKTRKYLRDRSDWEELCPSCHIRKDFKIRKELLKKGER